MLGLWTHTSSCCDDAKKHQSVFWLVVDPTSLNYQKTSRGIVNRTGWATYENVALEYRGAFWVVNINFCPWCSKALPSSPS